MRRASDCRLFPRRANEGLLALCVREHGYMTNIVLTASDEVLCLAWRVTSAMPVISLMAAI